MKLTKALPKRSEILLIISVCLHECGVISTTQYYDFKIPMLIFWSYGLLLFLAVIMLKFTKPILQASSLQSSKSTKRYILLHSVILAILFVTCTVRQGVWGSYYYHVERFSDYDYTCLVTTAFKHSIAYDALSMLAALYTSILLYFSLRKSRAHQYGPSSSAPSFSPLLPIVPAILAAAVAKDPQRATYRSNLGYAYSLKGDLPKAIALYREALKLDDKLGSAWINLGNALAQSGQTKEAREAYLKAKALDPTDPRVKAVLQELDAIEKGGNAPAPP